MRFNLKLIIISLSVVCLSELSYGQDAGNFSATALQLSNTFPGGSARIRGLGGAQTALGGDISNISSNPAGLGFFNRSEFSFTPNFNYIGTSSDYLGSSKDKSRLNVNFANLGIVFNNTKDDIVDGKWRGGNFGISINRIADFQNEVSYQGENFYPINSNGDLVLDANNPKDIIEFSTLTSSAVGPDPEDARFDNIIAELVYEVFATEIFEDANNPGSYFIDRNIYAVDENGDYLDNGQGGLVVAFPESDFPTRQSETVRSKGAIYQTTGSYGGNYNDKLYFGASIGLLSMNQEVERTYIEEPTLSDLTRLILSDDYEISGVGINASFGAIVRPMLPLLIGVSYTSPSYYSLDQVRTLSMTAEYLGNSEPLFYEFQLDPFEFTINTPSKLKAGITYFFGKNGFITGDIERVNYAGAKLRNASDDFDFALHNQSIDRYETTFNYRSGVEFRINKFRVRGGFAHLSDPVDDELDQSKMQLTFGGGMRTKNYFVDLGIIHDMKGRESLISPYPGADVATATTENTKVAISVGWFF